MKIEKYLILNFHWIISEYVAEKKLGWDGNCARKIPTFLYRIKSTKYVLKLQKSEKYLLQMRKRVAMVVTRDPFPESPDN